MKLCLLLAVGAVGAVGSDFVVVVAVATSVLPCLRVRLHLCLCIHQVPRWRRRRHG